MFKYIVLAFAMVACVAAKPGYLAGGHAPLLSAPLATHSLSLAHAAPAISYGHALAPSYASYAAPAITRVHAAPAYASYAAPALHSSLGYGLGGYHGYRSYAAPAIAHAPALSLGLGHGLGHGYGHGW